MTENKAYTQTTVTEDMRMACYRCFKAEDLTKGDVFFTELNTEGPTKRICTTCMKAIEATHETAALPETITAEAAAKVKDRSRVYGSPYINHCRIAELWDAYLNRRAESKNLSPGDVALMMILLKIARLEETPDHHDSIVDIIGYSECYAEIMQMEERE